MADYYLKKKQYQKGIEEYKKALKENPKNPGTLNNYAWSLAVCPKNLCYDPQKAIQLSPQALLIKRTSAILDTLAVSYAETGNYSTAASIMKDVINKKKEYGIKEKDLPYFQNCLKAYKNKMKYIDK